MPLIVIRRQLDHSNLGITSIYLRGIDNAEINDTVQSAAADGARRRSFDSDDARQRRSPRIAIARSASSALATIRWKMQRFFGAIRVLRHAMHEHECESAAGIPSGPFGYRVCEGCGVAIQRRLADGHVCAPARYAAQQASRLYWRRAGFDDALSRWLQTPAGHFAQYYARRMVRAAPTPRPGGA